MPAYNLAVVVDDAAQGVDQVVRGDDLLSSSPRQAYLARLLGYPEPTYAHVALVLNEDGARLAKRDGAVTLAEIGAQQALAQIAESLGWQAATLDEMLAQFDPTKLPRRPWIYRLAKWYRAALVCKVVLARWLVTRRASGHSTRARRPPAVRHGTAGVRWPRAPHRAP